LEFGVTGCQIHETSCRDLENGGKVQREKEGSKERKKGVD
jgi:hypothetical protein